MGRRSSKPAVVLVGLLVLLAGVALGALRLSADGHADRVPPPEGSVGAAAARAFKADSWWNTPLPTDTPLDPRGPEVLRYLSTAPESGQGCLVLAGSGDNPWGQPIYTARNRDRAYDVQVSAVQLPELQHLRIPVGAEAAANNDRSMTVYDRAAGYVVMLTGARYDASQDSWSARGASVTYLRSNGLHVRTGLSDDRRNRGSNRGNNGATAAVSWDEVAAGAVRHVLKIASGPELSAKHVFPMVGSDGDYRGSDPAVPPQGLRLRIKPSVDLGALHLAPQALVIARALQTYGMYIGDSGGRTALKLEDTRSEGRGQRWRLRADALCALPFTTQYWDVVEPGYDPSTEGGTRR